MKDISQEKMTASRLPVSRFAHSFLLALLIAPFYGISAHGGALDSSTLGETKNAATQSAATQKTANPSPATLVASDESKVTSSKTAQAPLTPQPNSIESQKPQRKDSPDNQYTVSTYIVGGPGHYSTRITILEKLTRKMLQTVIFPGGISELHWLPKSAGVVYTARGRVDSPVHMYLNDARNHSVRDLTPFAGTNVQRYTISTTSPLVIAYLDLEKKDTFQPILIDTTNGATVSLNTVKLLTQAVSRMKHVITVESTPERQETMALTYSGPATPMDTNHVYIGRPGPQPNAEPDITLSGQDKFKSRLNGQAEQRILFLTPKDMPSQNLKSFTEDEKKNIVRVWQWVCEKLPGLALRAIHDNKRLYIARIGTDESYSTLDEKKKQFAAAAQIDEVKLADLFFGAPVSQQYRMLVHELVHEADAAGHLSESQEWLSLIKDNISEAQAALKFSRKHGLVELNDSGAKYFGLPSMYAAESPAETLAEWTTAYIFGTINPPSKIRQFIEQKVLNPDCPQEKLEEKFVRAVYENDANSLREITSEDPDFLQAKLYLIQIYLDNKNYKQALAVTDEMITRIDTRKLYRISTNIRAFAYFQHGDILCRLNRYGEAQVFLNKAIALEPHNQEFLSAQKWMNNLRKNPKSLKKA